MDLIIILRLQKSDFLVMNVDVMGTVIRAHVLSLLKKKTCMFDSVKKASNLVKVSFVHGYFNWKVPGLQFSSFCKVGRGAEHKMYDRGFEPD